MNNKIEADYSVRWLDHTFANSHPATRIYQTGNDYSKLSAAKRCGKKWASVYGRYQVICSEAFNGVYFKHTVVFDSEIFVAPAL